MLRKTEGLTREQLAQPHPPSSLTLGGLLNHLALVEDSWFRVRFAGLPDDELWAGIDWDADPDYEFRTAADARARGAAPPVRAGLRPQPGGRGRRGEPGPAVGRAARGTGTHFDLRWMLLHLIEETARHAGHADLLREAIDGATGE